MGIRSVGGLGSSYRNRPDLLVMHVIFQTFRSAVVADRRPSGGSGTVNTRLDPSLLIGPTPSALSYVVVADGVEDGYRADTTREGQADLRLDDRVQGLAADEPV